jgi:hypothetical protein
MTVEYPHVGQLPNPAPDVALDERPARVIVDQRPRIGDDTRSDDAMTAEHGVEPGQVTVIPPVGALGHQFVEDARKQLLRDLAAAGKQDVRLAPLRDTAPSPSVGHQHVSFDDGDAVVELAECPGGEQPTHACSENDGVFGDPDHGIPPSRPNPRSALEGQSTRSRRALRHPNG